MSLLLLERGRGLIRGIKIPQQEFALKIQGGGLFVGHYGIFVVRVLSIVCGCVCVCV